ncbi:hypothetical protein MMC25_007747 [Agyrium rufum]|nr:hypothetical protein [Agyrium rufum]
MALYFDPAMRTSGYPTYSYQPDFPPPLIDNLHQRQHQHRSLLQYWLNVHPAPELHPNQPDVDIRESTKAYYIDVEVPSFRNISEFELVWTGKHSLLLQGTVNRPPIVLPLEKSSSAQPGVEASTKPEAKKPQDTKTTDKDHASTGKAAPAAAAEEDAPSPRITLIVGERRIGAFRRHFHFPDEIDKDSVNVHLEAGVLTVWVQKAHAPTPVEPWVNVDNTISGDNTLQKPAV